VLPVAPARPRRSARDCRQTAAAPPVSCRSVHLGGRARPARSRPARSRDAHPARCTFCSLPHLPLQRLIGQSSWRGKTTPTDPRSKRIRASRRGGHLLTRPRGPSNKNGLPVHVCSKMPPSRTVAPYSPPRTQTQPQRGPSARTAPAAFHTGYQSAGARQPRDRPPHRRRRHLPQRRRSHPPRRRAAHRANRRVADLQALPLRREHEPPLRRSGARRLSLTDRGGGAAPQRSLSR
jgi:hypothetical protein